MKSKAFQDFRINAKMLLLFALHFSEICPVLTHALFFALFFLLYTADFPASDVVLSKCVYSTFWFISICLQQYFQILLYFTNHLHVLALSIGTRPMFMEFPEVLSSCIVAVPLPNFPHFITNIHTDAHTHTHKHTHTHTVLLLLSNTYMQLQRPSRCMQQVSCTHPYSQTQLSCLHTWMASPNLFI